MPTRYFLECILQLLGCIVGDLVACMFTGCGSAWYRADFHG